MDFWDLTRLLSRRWYFAIPMLVLTAAAAMWTLVGVKPNYIATAYVQMVPPVTQPTQPGQQSADQRNPWITLGPYTLANAAIVTVQDDSVVEQLIDAGYSDTFTATLNSASPLITFEVTGSTEAQAAGTANELVNRVSQSVKELQSTYAALPGDYISTRRLDLGTNIKKSDAKLKRALVAVIGAGLLFTVAWTVGLDAWLRRRARIRAGFPPADPVPATLLPGRPGPSGGPGGPGGSIGAGPRFDPRGSPPRTFRTEPSPPARTHPDLTRSGGVGTATWPGNGVGSAAALTAEHEDLAPDEADEPPVVDEEPPLAPAPAEGAVAVVQPDSTVVLPLSYKSWRNRDSFDNDGMQPR